MIGADPIEWIISFKVNLKIIPHFTQVFLALLGGYAMIP